MNDREQLAQPCILDGSGAWLQGSTNEFPFKSDPTALQGGDVANLPPLPLLQLAHRSRISV